jgi:hypothetical protein
MIFKSQAKTLLNQNSMKVRDLRLRPWLTLIFLSSGLLYSVKWFDIDVSGLSVPFSRVSIKPPAA